ncbi:MAG: DNA-directed RNA polymerase subunit alpha [Calditrichaceae bacterium]|nr:DNA-directed RNA polymerase subunit alpha [Calditrichaceae bacterium]MBN2709074.1 DNA-directed RNA polymerase subunit alpha [Calditrichaceae bacterium]RQV97032.1 MAG: DNA-directed RNA polymerase subunit alpha [Calditrichota bacterium]
MNWSNLQMPERIELDDASYSNNFGRFIVQPLEKGYGVTIGNMMRRVLLSSLQGAAVTAIKVNNIQHEFSTIPGVYEDLPEIILNLKELRLKLLNKRPDKISLYLKGAGEFSGKTIQDHSNDIEILNPDLHIATLNENAELNIELSLGRGRGYITAEENKTPDMPIGVIPIDSIFTPILNVRYQVENTRVGQRTDFEKLVLEIETDGSITPDDALTFSGKILRDHIQLFINFDIESEEEETAEIDEEALRIKKLLKMSVDELELSVRSHNCLKAADIKTIGDLVRKDEQEMLKFKNFGRKSLMELGKILEERGLQFGMNVDKYLKSEEK